MSVEHFNLDRFLHDLDTFIGFETVVCQNPEEFRKANAWIRTFFDPSLVDFVEFECHGLTSTLIKPKGSERPNILGDGHIEVVPGARSLFRMVERDGVLIGRGVADMKTQCLMMIWAYKRLLEERNPNDFWLLFSEDEEVGSKYGVEVVVSHLRKEGIMPPVVFAPDGGPNFAYVEKEKGICTFEVETRGTAAHASRPFLGENAILKMEALHDGLRARLPNPTNEGDWVPSLSMTKIRAGDASNQIPDSCTAVFDLRFTELLSVSEVQALVREHAETHGGKVRFLAAAPATYYPKEAPIARKYLELLRKAAGAEPHILHSAGASNGRIYVAADPSVHVLMSSPRMGSAHAESECVEIDSLPAYYQLVYETAKLRA